MVAYLCCHFVIKFDCFITNKGALMLLNMVTSFNVFKTSY